TPLPPAGAADATGLCTIDPTVISRISMDDNQHCTGINDDVAQAVDSRCNPTLTPACADPARALLAQLKVPPAPADPCFFVRGAGPTEVPYLVVVDQRRLGRAQGGGPTRGQVLRIRPLGYPVPGGGLQPIFEDFQRSNNLFPIQ